MGSSQDGGNDTIGAQSVFCGEGAVRRTTIGGGLSR